MKFSNLVIVVVAVRIKNIKIMRKLNPIMAIP
jgi:hypothetical protein